MTGWMWVPAARGRCTECGRFVVGLWRYWTSPTVAQHDTCWACADSLTKDDKEGGD